MKKLTIFSVFILLVIAPVIALAGGKAKPLPKSTLYFSDIDSLDQAVSKMYVSHPFTPSNKDIEQKVASGVDLIQLEADAIEQLISSPTPVEEKEILMIRYELGDERITNVLIKAKNAGIRVRIVTDLNTALQGSFADKQKLSFDFKNATPRETPSGKQFQALLAAGFILGDAKHFFYESGIWSQPLFPESSSIKPIMHEKALLLREKINGIAVKTTFHGTTNLVPNLRYNRTFEINDPAFYDYYYQHGQALIKTFAYGKQIKDINSLPPLKIIYKDGSFQEIAFTDGNFNPNDRMIDFYTQAAANADQLKILSDIHSQFVFTNKNVYNARRVALVAQPKMTFFDIYDDRFIDLGGYGISAGFAGFDNYAEFGKGVFGLEESEFKRGNVYAYQRIAVDPSTGEPRTEKSENGPPVARHVWHDKTHITTFIDQRPLAEDQASIYEKLGVPYTTERIRVDTGSLNCSNHFENAEVQVVMNASSHSPLLKGIIESIEKVVLNEPDFAVHMPIAVFRNSIAMITGHTDLGLPLPTALHGYDKLKQRDYNEFIKYIMAVAVSPSTLEPRPDIGTVLSRVTTFNQFLNWYRNTTQIDAKDINLKVRKLLALPLILVNEKLSPYKAKIILREIIRYQGLTEEKEREIVDQALNIFGISFKEKDSGTEAFNKVVPSDENTGVFSWNFGWDNNVMLMPTKVYLFEKGTRKQIAISQGTFSKIQHLVGKEQTPWANYIIDSDPHFGSFREIQEAPGDSNFFLQNINFNLENIKPEAWQGPSFYALLQALSTPESARRTTIFGPPGHSTEEMLEGIDSVRRWLETFKSTKIYLPPKENLFSIGTTANPSLERLSKMIEVLDKHQRESEKTGVKISWGFSDDNYLDLIQSIKGLNTEVLKNRWPNIKIVLYYTGSVTTNHPIKVIILRPNGEIKQIYVDGIDHNLIPIPIKDAQTCNALLTALPMEHHY